MTVGSAHLGATETSTYPFLRGLVSLGLDANMLCAYVLRQRGRVHGTEVNGGGNNGKLT
jgi:hypothetical protein